MSISENGRRRSAQRPHALEQHSIEGDRVLTFAEWCALNKIGQRTGRRIIRSGAGPVVTQLSARRIGITVANNRAWQASKARV
jgi:hypothetical protein